MNAGRASSTRHRPDSLRWAICFALALSFHAAGAAALRAHWSEDPDLLANAPVIMIELAPLAVTPDIKPNQLPPGPQQTAAQPEPERQKPVEKAELPPDPKAEPLLAVTPPPKPLEKLHEMTLKQKHASLTTAPSTVEHKAEHAAAPMPGASSSNPNAFPNWMSQLAAALERNKRYPEEAQSRGEHGTAQLAFSIDRNGGVHHARIARSSGSSLLDSATLALVARAAPLPPPPSEVRGSQIEVAVPIRYNIR